MKDWLPDVALLVALVGVLWMFVEIGSAVGF